jgi:predicted SAM-dependent methyltransferase
MHWRLEVLYWKLREASASYIQGFLGRHGFQIIRSYRDHPSETSKCRDRLAPFCIGYGLDVGFGGDPINETAIRVDMPRPYTRVGIYPVQLGGDAIRLQWFADGTLDYVYSSHLLEDFTDTRAVLIEWLRVLRSGGRLIIFCPDQVAYEAYCKARGLFMNPHHVHLDFSLHKVQGIFAEIGQTKELHAADLLDEYSWEIVVAKL